MRSARPLVFLLVLICAGQQILFAQSNQVLDEFLEQSTARADMAAQVIFGAAGKLGEDAGPDEAMALLRALGPDFAALAPEAGLTMEQLSLVFMKAFDLKGGLMYGIFPGPRYAYREMTKKGVVPSTGGPGRVPGGEDVVRSLRYAMELAGVIE